LSETKTLNDNPFNPGCIYEHLADKITSDEITKRTLKNGLIKFLREQHPEDFVETGSEKKS
jgi:hypothetical protein